MASLNHVPRWTPTVSPSSSPSPLLSNKENDSSFAYHDQEEDETLKNIFPFSTSTTHHDDDKVSNSHHGDQKEVYGAPSLRIDDYQLEEETKGGSTVMEMEPIDFMTGHQQQQQQQHDRGSWEGVVLTWEDLCVGVPSSTSKGNSKAIIGGLNGYAEPGEVLAIMGPSGSGKSTLLDALAGNLLANLIKFPPKNWSISK
ncbi:hypothetical protein MKW94_013119 [Papaver nudicaule]|uniref:ABC transporter domain-containing protein n=1 Tax=Papaver nudicaule TaxID=74823 RepID=A0AA41SMI8_PAPNU|nr:hypothetical protein [Papaver nudicaule]